MVDETGFLKKGTKSVGVQRQYSGTAGRVENCQLGVFLANATPKGRAFVDRELYLPEPWVQDQARRREAGVPEAVTFATKPERARRRLERALAAGVPAAWVVGEEIYGDDPDLRHWLEAADHPSGLAVSAHHGIWHNGTQVRADTLVASLPAAAWAQWSAGEGRQGPRRYDGACLRLPYPTDPERAQWLLARRSLSDPSDRAYFRACGPATTTLVALAQAAGLRWAIEVSFEDAKDVVGLDHYEVRKYEVRKYEVRKWAAWYRHITLALLAHAYLAVTRRAANDQEANAEPPATGKKGEPRC